MSRETVRSTSPRLFLLPLSTLLSHPGKPLSSLKALLAAHPDLETGTCCRLVDTSCNNTLKTTASGDWIHTRAGAPEMTPHLQKRPRVGHQKQFKKEHPFTKQISRDGRLKEVLLSWCFCLSTRKASVGRGRSKSQPDTTSQLSERRLGKTGTENQSGIGPGGKGPIRWSSGEGKVQEPLW